jgi:hypothetical protein
MKRCLLIFLLAVNQFVSAQLNFEFSYGIGPSATFAKTRQTADMTWGYATPPFPHMGVQQLNFGLGSSKNNFCLAYDWGVSGANIVLIA